MGSQQDFIWVSPETHAEELGTYEQPVSDVGRAAGMARPGQHVVLKPGVYRGDATIQQSGLRDMPLHVRPETPGSVVIDSACWYLYDVSDVVVHGLRFQGAPAGAISVIGACCRNAFTDLTFEGCSRVKRPSCTMFFGGSGSRDNVIERCVFAQHAPEAEQDIGEERALVALMIAQGDSEGGQANMSFTVLENAFVNYGFGVLVGTRDQAPGLYGHLLECNTFESCRGDGVVVKCGDTTVRSNRFSGIGRYAVSVVGGRASMVEANRMVDCGSGCRVSGPGHTLLNNCIVRSRREAIRVVPGAPGDGAATVLAERNTIVDCAGELAVETEDGASCVLGQNLFSGAAIPYRHEHTLGDTPTLFAVGNARAGEGPELVGCAARAVAFPGRDHDDFTNNSGCGASGWALTTELPHREPSDYLAPGDFDDREQESPPVVERLVDEVDRSQLLAQGLFFEGE